MTALSRAYVAVSTVGLVLAIVFWLCAYVPDKQMAHVADSIISYRFDESVFDVVVASAVQLIFSIVFVTVLPGLAQRQMEFDHSAKTTIKILRGLGAVLSLSIFVFGICKIAYLATAQTSAGGNGIYGNATMRYVAAGGLIATSGLGLLFVCMAQTMVNRINQKVAGIQALGDNDADDASDSKQGKKKKSGANIRRLLGLAKPEIWFILGGLVCLIGSSASNLIFPIFVKQVVNVLQSDDSNHSEELNILILELEAIFVGGSILAMLRAWLFTVAGYRFVSRMRKTLFLSLIKQEVGYFDGNKTGDLTNRMSSDTQVTQSAVTTNISMLLRNLLQIIGSLVLMIVSSWKLSLVILATVPPLSIGAVIYGKFLKNLSKKFQDKLGEASSVAEESINAIRTVRSFANEPKSVKEYGAHIDESYAVGKKLSALTGLFSGVVGVVAQSACALVLWYGGTLVQSGEMNVGDLFQFMLYTLQIAMSFAFLSSVYGDFMKAVGASERIFEIMDREPEINFKGGVKPTNFLGKVEVKNIDFTYPARPDSQVLSNVSFTIEPGTVLAVVGQSGGGKTTTFNLIERFYDVDGGDIMIDGISVRDLDPEWMRRQIGYVSQEPTLFSGSIRDNIMYGAEGATEADVIEAAKLANAHDFITQFDDGYDTPVGERGIRLSGGQKQRISIARALIINPKILLLDEATSALDSESEHLVQEAIDRAMVSRSVLVIAHRLSTVRNADTVLVLDKGSVVESGSHDELCRIEDGIYKKLVARQLQK